MRTLRIIGIIGGSVAVIVAANAAFAEEQGGLPGPMPTASAGNTTADLQAPLHQTHIQGL